MNPLHQLSTVDAAQWRAVHRRAMASACGRIVHLDAERAAAGDELVALAVPPLARPGVFAMLAESTDEPSHDCASVLGRKAADVVRLLDRALAADGRDNDYPAAVWLERALRSAQIHAAAIATQGVDEMPLSTLVEDSAEALADVLIALPRDRLGVPDGLAEALGSLLVLYAAAAGVAD